MTKKTKTQRRQKRHKKTKKTNKTNKTKKTKKEKKDKKVISGDLVLMKYVKDPTIRHQIKLIFPSYFNLYSIKCSSFLSSCLEEKPFHSAGIGLPQFWQRHRGDPIPAQELDYKELEQFHLRTLSGCLFCVKLWFQFYVLLAITWGVAKSSLPKI